MADKSSLLPPSSTPVEHKLSQVGADLEDVPLPVRMLRRAATSPAELLPWLAWERSVDRWDDAWTEEAKRKAIANSFRIHKLKGTVGALRRVVEPLGYLLEVVEWWQMVPEGKRGTFQLTISVLDTGISEEMFSELARLIESTKRLSQHLVGLAIASEVRVPINYCVSSYDGDVMTVYPYQPAPVEVSAVIATSLATHLIDTITVYP
ncbi:phage tail protein I [Achromobacter denitrificans]|uniref:phage tail protein I n=1 Tax=Achromobacter denitrificans TaxID=32002 RepID=UPI000F65ABA2|nr:phage tail protein I [Achromobacter denitrificans]RSE76656.1 phage tail protein I [Achromobacter denitrificans]